MPTIRLAEARPLAEAVDAAAAPSGRLQVQIITPGWGSSGYYAAKVLEKAARDRVFPAGTHMYADHPSETEMYDRPERSVRDLAAVLTSDARWNGSALVAEAQVFEAYRPLFVDTDLLETIGLSIRASAIAEPGEAEGRDGTIITELTAGESVDFVTRPGRGGKVLQLMESAREHTLTLTREAATVRLREARNIGQWIESRLHLSLTQIADDMFGDGRLTREERIALSGAVGDGLSAFVAALEQSAPQLYQRDLWADPDALVAAAVEGLRVVPAPAGSDDPAHVPPVDPAGQSNTHESRRGTTMEIDEARLRTLEETEGRVPALEAERDQARTELATERARNTATTRARQRVTEANADLPPATVDRIVVEATRTIPLTEAGVLDEAAFDTATDTARTAEETYLAGLAEAGGAGRVTGFGAGASSTTTDVAEREKSDTARRLAFGRTEKKGA